MCSALVLPVPQPLAQGAPHMLAQESGRGASEGSEAAERERAERQRRPQTIASHLPARRTVSQACAGRARAGQREHAPFDVAEAGDLKWKVARSPLRKYVWYQHALPETGRHHGLSIGSTVLHETLGRSYVVHAYNVCVLPIITLYTLQSVKIH